MSITQLALTGFSTGLGVAAVVMACMSSYYGVRSSLREVET